MHIEKTASSKAKCWNAGSKKKFTKFVNRQTLEPVLEMKAAHQNHFVVQEIFSILLVLLYIFC